MAVRGDFRKLERLIRAIKRMTTPGWLEGLSREVGEAALEEIARSFATERDPWDRPWPKSLRAQMESGQTLSDTGRLRRSFTLSNVGPWGFAVGTNVRYAAVHQYGATIRPRRAKALRFRLPGGEGKRKGGKGPVVFAKSVTIPPRPFIPEPTLSPRWRDAFERAAAEYVARTLGERP